MLLYNYKFRLGKPTEISFIDSTTLDVCHNRRIHSHRVFKGLAERGKSSTGWFYGFKLHLTVNDKGEILGFSLTSGDVDDRNADVIDKITKGLFGKIESVNDFLKNICQIEHTRHRSSTNFLVNLIFGITAYSFLPNKPSFNIIRTVD